MYGGCHHRADYVFVVVVVLRLVLSTHNILLTSDHTSESQSSEGDFAPAQ